MKDLLLTYRLEGDLAKRVFEGNPEAAARSSFDNPEEGMAVLLSSDLEFIQELNKGLEVTLKLIQNGYLKECIIHYDHMLRLRKESATLALTLNSLLCYYNEDTQDENE